MTHAQERVINRLLASGIDAEAVADIVATADAFAAKCGPHESVALRLRTLSAFIGQAWSHESNGDTIVAIVRGREVQTYMFRRRTQPFDRMALNVERVVTL